MKNKTKLSFNVVTILALIQLNSLEATPQPHVADISTLTTISMGKKTAETQPKRANTSTVVIFRDDPHELRAIKAYCAGIDRYTTKKYAVRRDFVHTIDNSTSRWVAWVEVTGNEIAFSQALAGATAYKRNGKTILVECFSRDRLNQSRNIIRYYFRPDGTLAKLQTVVRTFQASDLDNKVVAIEERFQDKYGVVGVNTEFRSPKTGKRLKPILYAGQITIGFYLYSVKHLTDIPFFNQL